MDSCHFSFPTAPIRRQVAKAFTVNISNIIVCKISDIILTIISMTACWEKNLKTNSFEVLSFLATLTVHTGSETLCTVYIFCIRKRERCATVCFSPGAHSNGLRKLPAHPELIEGRREAELNVQIRPQIFLLHLEQKQERRLLISLHCLSPTGLLADVLFFLFHFSR